MYGFELIGSPVLGAAGSVFDANYANSVINGGSIGNTLTDFNVPSASIAWKVAGNYPNTPAYNAGVVFVSTNLATYAIDLTTHQAVWSFPLLGKLALPDRRRSVSLRPLTTAAF